MEPNELPQGVAMLEELGMKGSDCKLQIEVWIGQEH